MLRNSSIVLASSHFCCHHQPWAMTVDNHDWLYNHDYCATMIYCKWIGKGIISGNQCFESESTILNLTAPWSHFHLHTIHPLNLNSYHHKHRRNIMFFLGKKIAMIHDSSNLISAERPLLAAPFTTGHGFSTRCVPRCCPWIDLQRPQAVGNLSGELRWFECGCATLHDAVMATNGSTNGVSY